MADKKITELTELGAVKSGDLFVVVDSPGGTPITKRVTAKNFLNNLTYLANVNYTTTTALDVDTVTPISAVKGVVTSNVSFSNATASTLAAGQFLTTANAATSNNTAYQYAITATSRLDGATANVKVEHAAAKFVLDVSNAASLITKTYVGMLKVSNTGTRVATVQAFLAFGDDAANSSSAQTKYLFDIGVNATANVSTGVAGNSTTLFSNTSANTSITHKLRVQINGSDYFLLLTKAGDPNL